MSVITPGAPPQTLQGLVGTTVSEPSHPSKALAAVLVGAACICLQSFMFVLLLFFFPPKADVAVKLALPHRVALSSATKL